MSGTTIMTELELELTVAERVAAADGVVAIRLAHPDGDDLPAWTPGAHIDLLLGDDLVRQYSLCGDPADRGHWRIGVLLEPESRGGSAAVHALAEGDRVRVRGPRNHFSLVPSRCYVFIAGGIGITPLLPMIAEAEATGSEWHLHYGGRSLSTMAFRDGLSTYGDKVTFVPADASGQLDLASILGEPAPNTLVYTCGPEGLLTAVEDACAPWPEGSLHLERFSGRPIDDSGNTAFEIELERSGLTLQVGPEESVFDVVRAAGVSVLGSCLEGICGTCETEVLAGEIDHRDSVLDEEERESNELMMICVSRCRGDRLTLDL